MIKKLISLLTIVVLSINTFAVTISDNDGSAFVSKVELDSLKNDFQERLTQYNTSIDNKIDMAIASYLEGAKADKTNTKSIINSTWEEVSNVNGAFDNTYKVPNLDLQFYLTSLIKSGTSTYATASQYYYIVMHFCRLSYVENWRGTVTGSLKNCYRNLVTYTGSTPNDTGRYIWDGQALRYKESWLLTRLARKHGNAGGSWGWLDRPYDDTYAITMRNFPVIKSPTNTWVTNWDSIKTTSWPIEYYWEYAGRPERPPSETGTGTEQVEFDSSELSDNFKTTITLDVDPDEDNKTKKYEHIISNNAADQWRVYNTSWPNLLNTSPESGIYASNVKSAATKEERPRVFGIALHSTVKQGLMDDINCTHTITSDQKWPSLGMITNKLTSATIYQDDVEKDIDIGGSTVKKYRPVLDDGFQLIAAKKGDKITWEPIFNYTHVHNTATTYIDNTHEVKLYLSNGPFTDGVTTANPINVTVNNTSYSYATTEDRKVRINFEMPEDGIVYAKWIPDETTYIDSDWIVTLDVDHCNTYKYTRG